MKKGAVVAVVATIILSAWFFLKDVAPGIPRWLAELIVMAESSGNPKAVGPIGERGLFQFRESTWRWFTSKIYGKAKEQLGPHYTPALLAASFHYGFGRIAGLGYNLPQSASTHPNVIYRNLFKKAIA